MDSMFTEIDPEEHRALKRPVAPKFSMTSIRTLEYLVDPCSEIFSNAMLDLQGQVVDLGVWVQWYAFDVIGAITFARRSGFMERREDVNGVISGIERGLQYAGLIGQVPKLHDYLLGNSVFRNFLERVLPGRDPIPIVTQVSTFRTSSSQGPCGKENVLAKARTDGIKNHQRIRRRRAFYRED